MTKEQIEQATQSNLNVLNANKVVYDRGLQTYVDAQDKIIDTLLMELEAKEMQIETLNKQRKKH